MDVSSGTPLDVAIVGGGPIGLELAIELERTGLTYELFEAKQIGHTISWWAPQTRWFSSNDRIAIGGVPLETVDQTKATREQYLAYLRSVVRQFDLNVSTYSRVENVQRLASDFFRLDVGSDEAVRSIDARAIVLAIGGTDKPKQLNIPGANLPHVDSYFREPHQYFKRRVLIIGGRNSAVEAALRANQCGAHVSISYRQEYLPRESIKYWLLPEIEGLIRSGQIKAYFNSVPVRIAADHVMLERADINSVSDVDFPVTIEVDDVLSLIGYRQDKTLFQKCGVELFGESQRPIFDDATMLTNVPGIYVAGTAIAGTQSSKYRVFVENCHEHVRKIVASLSGEALISKAETMDRQEFAARIEAMPES